MQVAVETGLSLRSTTRKIDADRAIVNRYGGLHRHRLGVRSDIVNKIFKCIDPIRELPNRLAHLRFAAPDDLVHSSAQDRNAIGASQLLQAVGPGVIGIDLSP